MAKQKVIQTNFTGGEVSPAMLGRVDTVKYQNGAALVKNFIVRPQGGITRRSGSYYVAAVKTQSKATILIPFEYSDSQTYQLEFGEYYVRIYYDGGFVETAPSSGIPLEVVTLYSESQLANITYTQSGDVLYLFHPLYITKKLKRLGANSWSISDCDFQDGPYLRDPGIECDVTISSVNSYATAIASTGIFNAAIVKNKTVSAMTLVAGAWEFTSVGHTFNTADVINITGIGFQIAIGATTKYVYLAGKYAITKLTNDTFKLTTPPTWLPTSGAAVWTVSAGLAQTLTFASLYIDYKVNGVWKLAEILTVTNNTTATVRVVDNVKDLAYGTGVDWLGNFDEVVLEGTASGMFVIEDIGKYVRARDSAWWLITGLVDDSDVYMGGPGFNLTMLAYTYASTLVTVSEPTRQALVTSSLALFASTDVGRHMRFNFGGKQPWAKIDAYISTTSVLVEPKAPIPLDPSSISQLFNNGITSLWRLGAWSDTTGWPRTGVFHEQRLWFGGTVTEPLTVWASEISDYESMAPTQYDSIVLDTNAINYTIVSNKANPIQWMSSGATLIIGTFGSEWQVKSGSTISQPITPTSISITEQTSNGSLRIARPIRFGGVVAFIQKAGKKLIEIVYDFQQDSFVARNLNIVSEHILKEGGTKALYTAYQQEPYNIIWVCLANGSLVACTYDRDQQVMAWHKHTLGGNGFVESLIAVNSTAGTETLLYMIVRRTINGSTKRYIEYFLPDITPSSEVDIVSAYFLDCAVVYSGAAITIVTGLGHLEGESVSVMADGLYIGEKTVAAGQITLATAASTVYVGYNYTSTLKTLPQEGASPTGGTSQGKTKRTARTMVRVLNTRDFKYGTSLQNLDVKNVVDGNGTPVNKLATDDLGVNIPMNYNYTAQMYFVQDKPYPLEILAIAPDVEVTT